MKLIKITIKKWNKNGTDEWEQKIIPPNNKRYFLSEWEMFQYNRKNKLKNRKNETELKSISVSDFR